MADSGAIIFYAAIGAAFGAVCWQAAHRWQENMGIGFGEMTLRLWNKPLFTRDTIVSLAVLILSGGGGFALLAAVSAPPERGWIIAFAACLLLAATVDYQKGFIPDGVSFFLLALALARALWEDAMPVSQAAGGFLAAYALVVGVQTLFDFLRRPAIFWGDLKYLLALGAWFGFPAIAWLLCLAAILGLGWAVIKQVRVFPFAPFLSAAAFLLLSIPLLFSLIAAGE